MRGGASVRRSTTLCSATLYEDSKALDAWCRPELVSNGTSVRYCTAGGISAWWISSLTDGECRIVVLLITWIRNAGLPTLSVSEPPPQRWPVLFQSRMSTGTPVMFPVPLWGSRRAGLTKPLITWTVDNRSCILNDDPRRFYSLDNIIPHFRVLQPSGPKIPPDTWRWWVVPLHLDTMTNEA